MGAPQLQSGAALAWAWGRVTLGGSAPQQGSQGQPQEVERRSTAPGLGGVVLSVGTGVLGGIACWPCLAGLRASSPSPTSPPSPGPLERHDGGMVPGDNQVSSVWSERRKAASLGRPMAAVAAVAAAGLRALPQGCGQGFGRGRGQQRRDEPRGAPALPAAAGRSRPPPQPPGRMRTPAPTSWLPGGPPLPA